MKINNTTLIEPFQPITIEIIIESEQELNSLRSLSTFNLSIPKLVYKEYAETVKKFLSKLATTLPYHNK